MNSRDLKVQIAGDATQLLGAVERSERALGSLAATATTSSSRITESQARIDASMGRTSIATAATARAQEAASAGFVAASGRHQAEVQAQLTKTGHSTKALGEALTGLSLPIAAIGVGAAKLAVDFSKAMELVHTQAGYTQKQVDALSQSVLAFAPKVGVGPDELAQGLYHIASSGIPAAKAMGVLENATIGAKVGATDLESVTNALVGVLKTSPKDIHGAADAMGTLNSIVGAGNMRISDLVTALATACCRPRRPPGWGCGTWVPRLT